MRPMTSDELRQLIALIGVFLVIAVKERIVKIIKGHKAP